MCVVLLTRPGWGATSSFSRTRVNAVASTCRRAFLQHGGTSELWRPSMTPAGSDAVPVHTVFWLEKLSDSVSSTVFLQISVLCIDRFVFIMKTLCCWEILQLIFTALLHPLSEEHHSSDRYHIMFFTHICKNNMLNANVFQKVNG